MVETLKKTTGRKTYQLRVKGTQVWEDIPKSLFDLMRSKPTHDCRIVIVQRDATANG